MARPITQQIRVAIIEALKTTPNASRVAKQIGGVGYQTVRRIAVGERIKMGPPGKPSIPEAKRTAIIDALKTTPNASRVAKQIEGVCLETVRRIAIGEHIKLSTGRPRITLRIG